MASLALLHQFFVFLTVHRESDTNIRVQCLTGDLEMSSVFAGDQNPGPQAAGDHDSCHSGTEEPADREGEKNPALGGLSLLT